MPELPRRDDPVRIVVESQTHLRAFARNVDPSTPDRLIAIARTNPDGSGWDRQLPRRPAADV